MSDLWYPLLSPSLPRLYRMPPQVVAIARLMLFGLALLIAGLPMSDALAATAHHTSTAKGRPTAKAKSAKTVKKRKKVARKPTRVQRKLPAAAPAKRATAKRHAKRQRVAPKRGKPVARAPQKTVPPRHAAAPAASRSAAAAATAAVTRGALASAPTAAEDAARAPMTAAVSPAGTPGTAAQPRLLARCGFTASSRRHLFSSSIYIVDEQTHTPLFARNADAVVPIASVSKLMTAVVWLDRNALPMRDRLDVTDDDLDTLKFTHSRLSVGSEVTRADMLHIALMSSENRAAAALSRDYPGGRPAFIAAMNTKAQMLGMPNTRFVNATGLSPENVSTARELANLVRVANDYALIRRYSTDNQQIVSTGRGQLQYVNTNRLVRYRKIDASVQKTGFINESGHNMVMRMLVHDRRPVIVTMLGSDTPEGSRLDGVRIAHWLSCSLR